MGKQGEETYKQILEIARNNVREEYKRGNMGKENINKLEHYWKKWDFDNRKNG